MILHPFLDLDENWNVVMGLDGASGLRRIQNSLLSTTRVHVPSTTEHRRPATIAFLRSRACDICSFKRFMYSMDDIFDTETINTLLESYTFFKRGNLSIYLSFLFTENKIQKCLASDKSLSLSVVFALCTCEKD